MRILHLVLAVLCALPALSKVKMSPSHLAALLGVLGSELQLERRRLFLFGEICSSVAESKSGSRRETNLNPSKHNERYK